jgi:protoporphyrinogen oxidase
LPQAENPGHVAKHNPEPLDVAIIGAGPAGLVAAYRLHGLGLSVKVFEALDHVGGRTRCAHIAGETVNTGAMFVYVGSESEAICRELEIPSVPVSPSTFGVSLGGKTVIAREDAELLNALDLPSEASQQLAHVIKEVRKEYAAYMGKGGLTEESKQLSKVSLSQHLGPLHPLVDGIVSNGVKGGSTADPGSLSAQYALRYFASYLVRAKGHRVYLPDGMQEMSNRLAARLDAETVQLNTAVGSVKETSASGYELVVLSQAGPQRVVAKQVIFAVPGPGVVELAPWLPDWKLDAIERISTNPTVTLAIVLDSKDQTQWDDIFFVVTVDAAFNMVLQPRSAADVVPSSRGTTCFYCYLSADARAAAQGDDEAMKAAWLEDFYRVIPNSRGRVIDSILTRWERCFAPPAPGRDDALGDVRASLGGLHFAGDYTSDTAGSHGAFVEGNRVARAVLETFEKRS